MRLSIALQTPAIRPNIASTSSHSYRVQVQRCTSVAADGIEGRERSGDVDYDLGHPTHIKLDETLIQMATIAPDALT